eukprot:TRINITY_DN5879_c0_g1_i2.p1 TRINITY_DN5879_c0_g1~~TRINITY_DN5879_c0_g1_i2.p1  ORF type:complete len:131 (+),score=29.47 TRINITY_DN5879_c0_g1_i2:23-394(+)
MAKVIVLSLAIWMTSLVTANILYEEMDCIYGPCLVCENEISICATSEYYQVLTCTLQGNHTPPNQTNPDPEESNRPILNNTKVVTFKQYCTPPHKYNPHVTSFFVFEVFICGDREVVDGYCGF